MKAEQVREIVKMTLDELSARGMLKDSYTDILRIVEGWLYKYFNEDDRSLSYSMNVLSDDPYIDIIYLQYRDGKTIEWIAEAMDKDESTIKRNKKRLIMRIHELRDSV